MSATDSRTVSQQNDIIRHVRQEHTPKDVSFITETNHIFTRCTHKLHCLIPNNRTTHKETSLIYPAIHATRQSEIYPASQTWKAVDVDDGVASCVVLNDDVNAKQVEAEFVSHSCHQVFQHPVVGLHDRMFQLSLIQLNNQKTPLCSKMNIHSLY